jgi:hypothetical protein
MLRLILENDLYNLAPETRATELYSCVCSGAWTALLTLPVHLFSSNLSFLGLAHNGTEQRWALATGIVCAIQFAGWRGGMAGVRWAGLWLAFGGWLHIAICIAMAAPRWHGLPVNAGFYVYSVTAGFNLWAMTRVFPYIRVDLMHRLERRRGRMIERKGNRNVSEAR